MKVEIFGPKLFKDDFDKILADIKYIESRLNND